MSKDERINYEHMLQEHSQIKGIPPLPPTPAELTGFDGWREEDDAYWEDFRGREVSFRAETCYTPEDIQRPPQPLDRHGNPTAYPAAAQYDFVLNEWVSTSEEEEELLRNPLPEVDPFFVSEAGESETHTTLVPPAEIGNDVLHDCETDSKDNFVIDFSGSQQPFIDLTLHRRKALDMQPGAWRVVHLGTSSAVPTSKRNVSSTAVIVHPESSGADAEPSMFIVDAGENTDDQLIRCDWCMTHGFRWIRAIFITHLHGDHIYGLPALLTSIGRFAQHKRRLARESGGELAEPVIQIYGPYGTRGFLRSSLYWTNPVGVRFSVSELVPRETDFAHLRKERYENKKTFIVEQNDDGGLNVHSESTVDVKRESPPPHPEEVRVENTQASPDGLWHIWANGEQDVKVEVVAAPLRHRLPCFGYVFREPLTRQGGQVGLMHMSQGNGKAGNGVAKSHSNGSVVKSGEGTPEIEIDKTKAKELGVHGTQLRVLRSGRSITVAKTGQVVHPHDVALVRNEERKDPMPLSQEVSVSKNIKSDGFGRKVTVLGDTCDSSMIREAAMDSDLLVHEATFTQALKRKARVSMHSTAEMAGAFGREINAKKLALSHFSSRFEMLQGREEEKLEKKSDDKTADDAIGGIGECDEGNGEDLVNPNLLVREALRGYGTGKGSIVAAQDFMEHDIIPMDSANDHSRNGAPEPYAVKAETSQAT